MLFLREVTTAHQRAPIRKSRPPHQRERRPHRRPAQSVSHGHGPSLMSQGNQCHECLQLAGAPNPNHGRGHAVITGTGHGPGAGAVADVAIHEAGPGAMTEGALDSKSILPVHFC